VVIKVASSVVKEPAKYWPPALPDAVETIAASYVQTATSSKVVSAAALSLAGNVADLYLMVDRCCEQRLFNLSPNTKVAGMSCSANGTKEVASDVQYSLGSDWYDVPTVASTFSVHDDLSGSVITTRQETPPAAPIGMNTTALSSLGCVFTPMVLCVAGFTNMLIGLQGAGGPTGVQLVPLADAPEGGLCKP